MIEVIQSDFMKYMGNCGQKFDCIITDPPYDSLMKWQGIGTTARMGFGKDKDAQESDKFFPVITATQVNHLLMLCHDVLKKNSHCYIMCDAEYMVKIMEFNRVDKIFDYAKPLVWDKVSIGMGYHWRCRHEFVVMLEKGKRKLNNLGLPDILIHKKVSKGYPTEKPLGLYKELLLNSTNEGDLILDPFCGSGVLGEACQMSNRNAILVDISDRAISLTKNRIEQTLFKGNS